MKGYVVLDLEMCKVPSCDRGKQYNRANEIIQIGAVLLDDTYQIIGEFNTYVKPKFGKLDSFIKSFTGISWDDLKSAPSFEEALQTFVDWIPNYDIEMVSWSDNDRTQLAGEMKSKGLNNERMEILCAHWIDSQVTLSEMLQSDKCFSLEEALIVCDISGIGQAHDGFYDAYNTALLFKKLMTESELKLNHWYLEAKESEKKPLSSSIGELFLGLNLNIPVAV